MSEIRTLVTGAAGFIGMHVCRALLLQGEDVLGIDELNDYYDQKLKDARVCELRKHQNFRFHRISVGDLGGYAMGRIDRVIHLAARAGVRNSTKDPVQYGESNIIETIKLMEQIVKPHGRLRDVTSFVYASSSSVKNIRSIYGATKHAVEDLVQAYAHLYELPCTGLRFHTVYGPWGRPDMAIWKFVRAAVEGKPIDLYNNGDMARDFTYVDDIVNGIVRAHNKPGPEGESRIYDLGGGKENDLMYLVNLIEKYLETEITKQYLPMQKGDAKTSLSDNGPAHRDLGYAPKWTLEEGLAMFIGWYLEYHGIRKFQGMMEFLNAC